MVKLCKNKAGQLFMISGFLLISLLLFIYSLETQNSYIVNSVDLLVADNIVDEVCEIGFRSNGSNIDSRFSLFESSVETYCTGFEWSCDLIVLKDSGAPSDLSLLNYSFYNFTLEFIGDIAKFNRSFDC